MWKRIHAGGYLGITLRILPLLPMALGSILASPQRPAESPRKEDAARFTVDLAMVVLPVTVLNAKGGFAKELQERDFQVFENGVRQKIRLFRREDVPVSVGLVVDNSGSMRRKRKDVAAAAEAFVRKSNPEDEMFVVNFSDRPVLGLPDTKLFSADPGDLRQALSNASTRGRTALYDAIEVGLSRLRQASHQKKVLIVVSDGGDNASASDLASALEAARRSDVLIYALGLFDEYDKDRNPKVLKQLARITGGKAFFPSRIEKATQICERIAEEIRSQYTIGYVSTNKSLDGTYRKVRVRLAGPHRGKLSVRTRDGYFAIPDQPQTNEAGK